MNPGMESLSANSFRQYCSSQSPIRHWGSDTETLNQKCPSMNYLSQPTSSEQCVIHNADDHYVPSSTSTSRVLCHGRNCKQPLPQFSNSIDCSDKKKIQNESVFNHSSQHRGQLHCYSTRFDTMNGHCVGPDQCQSSRTFTIGDIRDFGHAPQIVTETVGAPLANSVTKNIFTPQEGTLSAGRDPAVEMRPLQYYSETLPLLPGKLPDGFVLDYHQIQGWDKQGLPFVARVPMLIASGICRQGGVDRSFLLMTSNSSVSERPTNQVEQKETRHGGGHICEQALMSSTNKSMRSYVDSNPKRAYVKAKQRLRAVEMAQGNKSKGRGRGGKRLGRVGT